ncbi:ATP-binding protein [Alkalihalobacillus oceani]|uniref:histidine kinase n=1 Tax=Halalkalibacter oceani TaxID=1653776 RepID=A0A9X2IMT0_9BACI|nr:ATP-binding protein [Halalkalibacter oceani]MCM3713315.1 ATP-binding protein [Halalkalibacter oceani]
MFIELLLQMIYIFFPILFYYSLLRHYPRLKRYHSILIGIICGISIWLCMTFPITFLTGGLLDVRSVPWFASFLYGNFTVGTILTVLMIAYRLTLGGMGFYVVLLAYVLSYILIFVFFKNYLQFSFRKKIQSTCLFIVVHSFLIVLFIQLIFPALLDEMIWFYLFNIGLHLVMMWVVVYMIETFRENDYLHMEMQKSEKLYIIGQMAASVAHEIRNPMTVVSGFMQILSRSDELPAKHKEHISIMTNELERAQMIINDYLTLAKPQVDKAEKIDLCKEMELISQTLSSYALMNGVELRFEGQDGQSLTTYGSREKLQQVLINMIKNAIEASPAHGEVTISLSKAREWVYIRIIDKGVGLSEDQLAQIGTPFYSTKEKGTGLGLTVSFSIIRSMNGTIEVTSKKGAGTTFTIRLPAHS